MKRLCLVILLGGFLAIAGMESIIVSTPAAQPCGRFACGMKPIKPIPPIGCKDVLAVCTCDSKCRNCHWEWVCVTDN